MLTLEKILQLYSTDPKAEFTIRQISQELDIAYGHVYERINKFIQQGFFIVKKVGKANICTLNIRNTALSTKMADVSASECKDFLSKDSITAKFLNEFIDKVEKKTNFSTYSIVLFGSFAKGTNHLKSDIDILILVSNKKEFDDIIHQECGSLEMQYGKNINPVIVTPQMYLKMMQSPEENIGKQVLKNKTILSGGEKYWQLTLEAMK